MTSGKNGIKPARTPRYDYHCPACGRLWFRAHLAINTYIEIRCGKCGQMMHIRQTAEGTVVRGAEQIIVGRLTE
jgi:phage FluMu protein Com